MAKKKTALEKAWTVMAIILIFGMVLFTVLPYFSY